MADQIQPKVDPNFVNEAGDVITETMVVTSNDGSQYDVSNFVLQTVLYEDLFSNTLSGECIILDAANLITKIPFQGIEYLTFSFRTPSFTEKIEKTFKITAIKDRGFTSADREQAYALSFVSLEAAIDNVTNLSKKYSGSTDAVVSQIWNENLSAVPRILSQPQSRTSVVSLNKRHSSSVSFIATSWNPFKAINWVASRSFQHMAELAGFMFYESNKAFYFRNVEEVIDTQTKNNDIFAQYVYFPGANTIQNIPKSKTLYTKPELTKQYSIVRNMKPFGQFDILDGQDKGFYAAKLITHDIALKTYQEFFFDYYGPYTKEVTPNKNTEAYPQAVFRNPEVNNRIRTKHYKLHNDMNDPLYEKWMLQRNSLLYELSGVNIEIEVPGRTDIEVGKLVDFLYPKGVDKLPGAAQEYNLDPFMSAQYLISAIRHTFSLNKHSMVLELVRFV